MLLPCNPFPIFQRGLQLLNRQQKPTLLIGSYFATSGQMIQMYCLLPRHLIIQMPQGQD